MNFDKKNIAILIMSEYGKLEFWREINQHLEAVVLFWDEW